MKTLFNYSIARSVESNENLPVNQSKRNTQTFLYMSIIFIAFLFSGCKKYAADMPETNSELQSTSNRTIQNDAELLNFYSGLDPKTLRELQQARAATAKYQNINNAFADNYETGPVIQNMGYHFLKTQLVSPVFDLRKPALLVYSKDAKGNFQLAALEYAVPIDPQSPNTAPEGFTGNTDEWDFNTLNTGWWTLHAWVWKNNPDGVFKMMNPLVIVQ